MGFTVAGTPTVKSGLSSSDLKKWEAFEKALPKVSKISDAVAEVGTTKSTQYKKTGNQHQFRINGKDRVSFVLNGTTLSQVQVGGHS